MDQIKKGVFLKNRIIVNANIYNEEDLEAKRDSWKTNIASEGFYKSVRIITIHAPSFNPAISNYSKY